MSKISIAFVTHQSAFNVLGGAETQILKTKQHLDHDKNLKISFFDMWNDKFEDYDIVHIFNPNRFPVESLEITEKCKKKGVKVVVSPIFWISPYETATTYKKILFNKVYINSLGIPLLKNVITNMGTYKYKKSLYEISDMILPNTNAELYLLKKFYNISHNRFTHIPNGVDLRFMHGNPKLFNDKFNLDNFILYVGGLYQRKNVLRLIKAFSKSELDTNLVLIGNADQSYYSQCQKVSDERVIFLPALPHNSEMLISAYKSAKVVVLPSYFETPGLSCLEGGLAGSNIVITEIGGTKEYFEDYAWYINPNNEKDIQNTLVLAYNSPKTNKLSKHIEKNFKWETVAETTSKLYKSLNK